MEKKHLVNILSNELLPLGFKRKGNFWVINGDEITKMVNLQKSQYASSFYINYGWILSKLPLDTMMHSYNRVTSLNIEKRERIQFLLDLDSEISEVERQKELVEVLNEHLIKPIQKVNTEEDFLSEIKSRPNLNDVLLVVKRYFNLPLE